jgi:hypothetical protein
MRARRYFNECYSCHWLCDLESEVRVGGHVFCCNSCCRRWEADKQPTPRRKHQRRLKREMAVMV